MTTTRTRPRRSLSRTVAGLALGIGPQVELALLVSGFAMAVLLDALTGGRPGRPVPEVRPVPRSSLQLV